MSFDIGNKGERIVADYFTNIGYEVTPAPDLKFYDYDLECNHYEHSFTIEIKTDVSAFDYAKRRGEADNPRLFIEYYSDTNDEPSGIAASCATYYFYLLVTPDKDVECNVFDRQHLHHYLLHDEDVYTHTLVPRFGDHQTTGWLPYRSDLERNGVLKRRFLIGKW